RHARARSSGSDLEDVYAPVGAIVRGVDATVGAVVTNVAAEADAVRNLEYRRLAGRRVDDRQAGMAVVRSARQRAEDEDAVGARVDVEVDGRVQAVADRGRGRRGAVDHGERAWPGQIRDVHLVRLWVDADRRRGIRRGHYLRDRVGCAVDHGHNAAP